MGIWLARDKNKDLWVYFGKPLKYDYAWAPCECEDDANRCFQIDTCGYPEVTWENSPVRLIPETRIKKGQLYIRSEISKEQTK